jgi:MFS family permease
VTGQVQPRPPLLPISVLGLLTIVAYGACYYAYGVLIQPISTDTRWPDAALGAIFSAVLLISGAAGVLAGRVLDRAGERPVFVLAAVAGAGAMLAASFQSALLPFAIAYAGGCGLAGALGFYHITQAVAARTAPKAPGRAIIWLTLFGAFAGPVYLPLTGWLVESVGWRCTIRIESGTVAAAFVLAAAVVNGSNGLRRSAPSGSARDALRLAWRSPRMRAWLLATLIGGAAVDVFLVYQVPVMARAGLPLGIAAAVAGFRGVAQLAGRLPLGKLIKQLGARNTLMLAYAAGAIAALPLFASGTLAMALELSLFAGASIGALSSLQGIYTYELVDPRHLGMLLGAQQAVFGAGSAIGPVAAGALLGATGSYTPTIVIITAGFAVAACVLLPGVTRDRTADASRPGGDGPGQNVEPNAGPSR